MTVFSSPGRCASLGTLASVALCFFASVPPAAAQLVPESIFVVAEREFEGGANQWYFNAGIDGSGMTAATLMPPSGPEIVLTGTQNNLEFQSGSFSSFSDLLLTYPSGDYVLTLNGTQTATLAFAPSEPLGSSGQPSISLTTPSEYDRTPDVIYSLDCSNCTDMNVSLLDVATDGGIAFFGFEAFGQTPPASVPFSSLISDNMLTELPAGVMELEVLSGIATFSDATLSPSGTVFQYVQGGIVSDFVEFTTRVLEDVTIEASFEDQGSGPEWFLFLEAFGEGLSSVTLSPPSTAPIALTNVGMAGTDFDFESAGFASFSALQTAYPAGTWTLDVDGVQTASLMWNPVELTGSQGAPSLSITAPADGSVGIASNPDVGYALDCSNCDDLALDLFDQATDGQQASFETILIDATPFPNPIPFSSLTSEGGATVLPDGLAEAELLVGLVTFGQPSLSPSGQSFEYFELSSLIDVSVFTVPEPASPAAGAAALLGLVALRRRRAQASAA